MTRATSYSTTYSTADIARFAAEGRQLQGRAVRAAFAGVGRWVLRTIAGAVGRRATVHLGCSDCGAHA